MTGVDVEGGPRANVASEVPRRVRRRPQPDRKKAGIDSAGWDASISYLIAEVEMAMNRAWGVRDGEKGVNGLAKSGMASARALC